MTGFLQGSIDGQSVVDRILTRAGFSRAGFLSMSVVDDLRCAVAGLDEEAVTLLTIEDGRGPHAVPVPGSHAVRLGTLLFDAGCLSVMREGAAAFDEDRGVVEFADIRLFVRFRWTGHDQRVGFHIERPTVHDSFALWPVEAMHLGLILIRAGYEAAPAREAA